MNLCLDLYLWIELPLFMSIHIFTYMPQIQGVRFRSCNGNNWHLRNLPRQDFDTTIEALEKIAKFWTIKSIEQNLS